MQRLDHGVLNVPLSKRGNIDAQIDKYKAEKAKEDKKARQDAKFLFNEAKKEAKRLLPLLLANKEKIAEKAAKLNVTTKDVVIALKDLASSRPKAIVKIHKEWSE